MYTMRRGPISIISLLILTSSTLAATTAQIYPKDPTLGGALGGERIAGLRISVWEQPACQGRKWDLNELYYSQNVVPDSSLVMHSFKLSRHMYSNETLDVSSKAPVTMNPVPANTQQWNKAVDKCYDNPGCKTDGINDMTQWHFVHFAGGIMVNRYAPESAGGIQASKRDQIYRPRSTSGDVRNRYQEEGIEREGEDDGRDDDSTSSNAKTSSLNRRTPSEDLTGGLAECASFLNRFGDDAPGTAGQDPGCIDTKGAGNCFRIWHHS